MVSFKSDIWAWGLRDVRNARGSAAVVRDASSQDHHAEGPPDDTVCCDGCTRPTHIRAIIDQSFDFNPDDRLEAS
jgi:hypothetical protein